MSVLIFLDGVIRKPKDQSIILAGSAIYKSFNENYRVILIADNKERADIWLKSNNLAKKMDDIFQIVDTPLDDPKLLTVEVLRSKGMIDFVVTEDPELAKKLLEVGIPVLMFLNPRYTRPEFRPDSPEGVRSWASITEELDKQQGLYIEDRRLSEEEPLVEFED
jgi:rRNA-processing protein FCF1